MVVFLGWCLVVVFLWWCSCRCVCVVVLLWWCFCGGVFVVVFLCWCFCAGVSVVVFLWWCFCGVVAVVFLWWCFCGGVFVVVFLWWCFCGGVFVVVFLWWCTKYYSSTTKYYSSTTKYYSVLQSTTPYYKVLLQYYSLLQSTTPVLLRTTKYYSALQSTTPVLQSTTPHNKVILQYYSVLQKYYSSTTPYYRALLQPLKRRQNDVLPVYYSVLRQYYKSFQNEHFVRGFRNFSRNKLPKRAFRARLPPNFTERASKTSVSRDASDNFQRKSFQKDRFVRGFLQISQKKLPKRAFRAMLPPKFTEQASKTSVSRDASNNSHRKRSFRARLPPNFIEQCFQNERFARCFRQFSPKICVSLQFRAIDTTFLARGFIRQKQNVPRTTAPCIPKFQNVRFATAACAKMYESIDREPTRFAHTKNVTFYYSFRRSTPRFY